MAIIGPDLKVYFDNNHHCGDLVWDAGWSKYRFVPRYYQYSDNKTQTFDAEQMIEIGKAIKKVRCEEWAAEKLVRAYC